MGNNPKLARLALVRLPIPRAYVILFSVMDAPNYFIPDRAPRAFYPLASYLRPPAANVVAQYIQALTAPGDLVIAFYAGRRTAGTAHTVDEAKRRGVEVKEFTTVVSVV